MYHYSVCVCVSKCMWVSLCVTIVCVWVSVCEWGVSVCVTIVCVWVSVCEYMCHYSVCVSVSKCKCMWVRSECMCQYSVCVSECMWVYVSAYRREAQHPAPISECSTFPVLPLRVLLVEHLWTLTSGLCGDAIYHNLKKMNKNGRTKAVLLWHCTI